MDYKKVLKLHHINKLSSREIAGSCNCSKTTVNDFLRRFRDCPELSYPLPPDMTNEALEKLLYKKAGNQSNNDLYRDFNKEEVYRALSKKGETLKHLWRKYNSVGVVAGHMPLSYRQFCRHYSERSSSKSITFHIQRQTRINIELDFAGKQLHIRDLKNPEVSTPVTVFVAALSYSGCFYAEDIITCDIKNWIRVNNNALDYFGGVTPTVTPDNCKLETGNGRSRENIIHAYLDGHGGYDVLFT